MITFKPKTPEQMKEWMESELQRFSARPHVKTPPPAPETKPSSLLDAITNQQVSLDPIIDQWEQDINDKHAGGVPVSFHTFYDLIAQLKDLGGRSLPVPANVMKNANLTIHDEPNGYISYGFENASTGQEIDFILYEDHKRPYFAPGFKYVVEDENLYPGEGPVVAIDIGTQRGDE